MCLQIYIKEENQYYLTYIPDAKAYTDAPPDYMTLIKQRRRWMNGALFAAWKVITNWSYFLNLRGNTEHPFYRTFLMFVFLIYYFFNNIFSLTIVGSTFVAIEVFFEAFFSEIEFCDRDGPDYNKATNVCENAVTDFF